jgi:hypothetical protein
MLSPTGSLEVFLGITTMFKWEAIARALMCMGWRGVVGVMTELLRLSQWVWARLGACKEQ